MILDMLMVPKETSVTNQMGGLFLILLFRSHNPKYRDALRQHNRYSLRGALAAAAADHTPIPGYRLDPGLLWTQAWTYYRHCPPEERDDFDRQWSVVQEEA